MTSSTFQPSWRSWAKNCAVLVRWATYSALTYVSVPVYVPSVVRSYCLGYRGRLPRTAQPVLPFNGYTRLLFHLHQLQRNNTPSLPTHPPSNNGMTLPGRSPKPTYSFRLVIKGLHPLPSSPSINCEGKARPPLALP